MAITKQEILKAPLGPGTPGGEPLKMFMGKIAFDSDYPAGGEALDLSGLIADLRFVQFAPKGGYFFEYDYDNKKVKVMAPMPAHDHKALTVVATGEAADKTAFVGIEDGAGVAVTGVTVGHAGGAGADIDINTEEIAAAPGSEIAEHTNLSTLTDVRFIAYGV